MAQFVASQQEGQGQGQHHADMLSQIQQCFHKLFTERNVSLTTHTKLNERNFILNMRESLVELQLIIQDTQ
jgi:predicted glycoside hydrolase/deacetylase ChbG (UPF0249 family)